MQPQQQKIKIIMTDDHEIFRRGVIIGMAKYTDIQFIAEAEHGQDLLEKLEYLNPDMIIMGINMPVLNGLDTLPILKEKYPAIKVIMLTMYNDPTMICKAITLGANAYLIKTSECEEIYKAIMVCRNQWLYLNETLREALMQTALEYTKNGRLGFNEREQQVLELLAAGQSAQQIATTINLCTRTVDVIINRLLEKAAVKSLDALFKYAKEMQLI
jgi:DNA-binding NarL/FixJ family response regulator